METNDCVKVSDISDWLNLPRPGVTRTVKDMEVKGYLKKTTSQEDARITYITVTDKGRRVV
ncbi:MAG: MarR family winged helix-turn-helix transcriptional regulator [Lachnospira eligens]